MIRLKNNNKGFALLTIIILSGILFTAALSYFEVVSQEKRMINLSQNSIKAEAIAEAGMEEAFWEYNYGGEDFTGGGWDTGNPRTKTATFTDTSGNTIGTYTISISNFGNTASPYPVITSTGTLTGSSGNASSMQAVLKAEVRIRPLFTAAVQANDSIDFRKATTVDSYNSTVGAYGGANILYNGDVVTNSSDTPAIDFTAGSSISGDVGTGAGGTVDNPEVITNGGSIYDNVDLTMPDTDTKYATQIANCEALPTLGNITADATISLAGYYHYSSLALGIGTTLTVNPGSGEVYMLFDSTQAINMRDSSMVRVQSGKLILLVDGDVDIAKDAVMSSTANSTNSSLTQGLNTSSLTLVGTSQCTSIDADKNFLFVGSIIAPSATFQAVDKDLNMYGAVIANNFDAKKEASIHYDESLATNGPTDGYEMYWFRRI
jgi:hypothetical protein